MNPQTPRQLAEPLSTDQQKEFKQQRERKEQIARLRAANDRFQNAIAAGGVSQPKRRQPPQMKTGGIIKKTGVYTLHKGEVVVPATRVKSVDMALKKDKKKPLKK